mmetsp:Transcript_11083/g.25185  ORF Transcript_11083/g.25185 Transcript_11083/m.25185 type:complete len:638 (-) Transcript_11083:256-2169(-)|eukprot:CAMPEP_0197887484 /NCGR_PEP_ID=MMETSP1439-20131203/19445_1 /TAXON_ID=66791 /ORGANISM="Gonyaulax spinifera, Strain CCMP409" /LENGTH=637 /DNA_ID=CAMNT_0043507333 /DNA_START=78 /DNA_END=1991 /DNA_ORIENTATION=-
MAGSALLPALRHLALPSRTVLAGSRTWTALASSSRHATAGSQRACGSSCSGSSRSGGKSKAAADTGTAARAWGPQTTYEGRCDEDTLLHQLGRVRSSGFRRSDFVKERRCAEELRDKYDIGELLGVGATAKVYSAVNRRTGQAVAMKVICKSDVADQQLLQSEIQIHKATDHPNILRLLETFEDEERHYLVTELCEGGDLWRHLAANNDEYSTLQMPEEDALQLFLQVANSVMYLHAQGIAHRDLKPGNFLFRAASEKDPSGVIKLTDFGVSAYCGGRHRLTRTVGTERFMAPEIIQNKPYDEKSDIFSMGCILHMLLTGHPPKQKEDGNYAISKIRLQFVSNEVRALIEQLMQPLPENRPTARQISRMPVLQKFRLRLSAKTIRLDAQLLDQMYAYSSYPLLKKAALVAMVSRAESDADFMPSIEKFLSLDSNMTSGIDADDVYEALSEELLGDMPRCVRQTLASAASDGRATAPGTTRALGQRRAGRRRERLSSKATTQRFREEIRAEIEQLIHKMDASGTGQINFSEWLAATVEPSWYSDPVRISAVFRLFDFDGDGLISEDDLNNVIPNVFNKLTVDAVLQESQLGTKQHSWIREEHFALLLKTENPSFFTLQRLAEGVEGPLVASEAAATSG